MAENTSPWSDISSHVMGMYFCEAPLHQGGAVVHMISSDTKSFPLQYKHNTSYKDMYCSKPLISNEHWRERERILEEAAWKKQENGMIMWDAPFPPKKKKVFFFFYLQLEEENFGTIKSFLGVILSTINATLTYKYGKSSL
jgi:hypothetical protein